MGKSSPARALGNPALPPVAAPLIVEELSKLRADLASRGSGTSTLGGAFAHAAGLTADEDYEGWWPVLGLGFRYGYPVVQDLRKAGAAVVGTLDQLHTWLGGVGDVVAHGEATLAKDAVSAKDWVAKNLGWNVSAVAQPEASGKLGGGPAPMPSGPPSKTQTRRPPQHHAKGPGGTPQPAPSPPVIPPPPDPAFCPAGKHPVWDPLTGSYLCLDNQTWV
jgi:hypothetical protein